MPLFRKISRIVIVDDHLIFMQGLKLILSRYKFLNVVGEYTAPEFLLRELPNCKPDIVFLDVHTEGMKGWDAVREIHQYDSSIKVVAITQFSHGHVAIKMLEAGVCGYMVKTESKEELIELFEKMNRNEVYISAEAEINTQLGVPDISSQEFEIICLLATDKDNKNIAADLNISEKTLIREIGRIGKKLGVTTRAGIVAMAYKLKILSS